jgi:hypothetical protein
MGLVDAEGDGEEGQRGGGGSGTSGRGGGEARAGCCKGRRGEGNLSRDRRRVARSTANIGMHNHSYQGTSCRDGAHSRGSHTTLPLIVVGWFDEAISVAVEFELSDEGLRVVSMESPLSLTGTGLDLFLDDRSGPPCAGKTILRVFPTERMSLLSGSAGCISEGAVSPRHALQP